jgi:CSLREA domain-containing protein
MSLAVASLAALMLLLAVGLQPDGTSAAGITVNTTDDESNSDGDCSLREAIESANGDSAVDACTAGSGADVISVPAGTYVLSMGSLFIFTDMTVNGAGATTTIIDGDGVTDTVVDVGSKGPITVVISDVTIQGGNADGDGGGADVDSQADVTFNDSLITNNEASSDGGGIANFDGTVTLNGSAVTENTAGDEGGGIYNEGPDTLILNDSVVSGNSAEEGGGIMNEFDAAAIITNSTISDNSATSDGGGITNEQCCGVEATVITNSTVSGNSAGGFGGGIENADEGALDLTNVTISGNTAGAGGGISADFATTATLTNVTITDNNAKSGGGIYNSGEVSVGNTIVSANTSTNCFNEPQAGAITSAGHNMEDTDTCGFAATGDQPNTDPTLGALTDNGGPTETHALLAGSPAIDAADGAICPADDQRGVTRPIDGDEDGTPNCDVGAYEFEVAAPTPTATSPAGATPTATVAATGLPPTGSGPDDGAFPYQLAIAAMAAVALAAGGAAFALRRR